MAIDQRKLTTEQKQLGWRHRQQRDHLLENHVDGSACDWCKRPMWKDRTKNYDYDPHGSDTSGTLQADHSGMSRAEAIQRGLQVPLADRLLHGRCNVQRGNGENDHILSGESPLGIIEDELIMPWPWTLEEAL